MKRYVLSTLVAVAVVAAWALLPGSATAEDDPGEKAVLQLRKQVRKVNANLMMDNKYSCCMSPGCSFCTLATGGCKCRDNLEKGKPVCPCCKGGWDAGQGAVPNVKAADVKALSGKALKDMFRARKKAFKKAK